MLYFHLIYEILIQRSKEGIKKKKVEKVRNKKKIKKQKKKKEEHRLPILRLKNVWNMN